MKATAPFRTSGSPPVILKQVDPVGPSGEAILDYSVFDAIRGGFGKVVFIIRHDFEAEFKEKVGKKYEGLIPVDYCYQDLNDLPPPYKFPEGRTKPWGTAHAVRAARDVVKEPFAVINADDFYGRDAFAVIAADLMREITIESEISFVKLASYQGTTSTGTVKEVIGINENLSGRTVIMTALVTITGPSVTTP